MDNNESIQLPAIKGIIGDWVYYQTVMSFAEVVKRIDNDHSIREYPTLDDNLQRELSARSKKISAYLIREQTRFFNSAIIGVFGGQPNWYNFDFSPSVVPNMTVSAEIINTIGILELQGDERLFSIDGQHRIEGIKQAIRADSKRFRYDELPIIIIAHSDTREGKIRTRRLFSEINTKAVRVTGLDDLITNEENPADINTRKFYAEFKYFRQEKYIQLAATANINAEADEFTTILNLKEINKILYDNYYKHLDYRPNDRVIKTLYLRTIRFWIQAINNVPKYQSVFRNSLNTISDFRNENGGSMLFRPIGIRLLAEGYSIWLLEKNETVNFWKQFCAIDDDLNSIYWKDILWDNPTKKIKPKTSQRFLKEYIRYLLNLTSDLIYLKEEYNKLRGIEENDPNKVDLPDLP